MHDSTETTLQICCIARVAGPITTVALGGQSSLTPAKHAQLALQ